MPKHQKCAAWVRALAIGLAAACLAGFAFPQTTPPPKPATSEESGAELYKTYCASCHGKDAKGDGPAAPALKVRPPDLTTLTKKNGRFPDGNIYQIIKWGGGIAAHGSRDMPMWGKAFLPVSHQDEKQVDGRIRTLIGYLQSLQVK